ncbi:glycosyltransferase family 2 protein [Flavobacterium sp. GSP14]|uniref:glycosyltransferase family 2 protein n=1 Tax=Flavobacterium sp. GSP14 TaxID=3401734 RepID=UPI003AB0DC45
MTNKPLVTITLIAMNHEKYIAQACHSILNQTYNNLEVIFLDNNSNDKTFEIGDAILKNSGLKYFGFKNKVNKGVSENLNIQVKKASGEYISILSGDDWYEKENIEKRLEYLEVNNLDVILADGYKYHEKEKKKIAFYSSKRKKKIINTIHNVFEENIAGNTTGNVGFFVKKNILNENPFDEEVATEDWDINLRLSKKGYKFGFVDQKLFNYRILSTSLSKNYKLMQQSYLQVTNKYLEEIKSIPRANKSYQATLLSFEIEKFKSIHNKTSVETKELYIAHKNYINFRYNSPKKEYKKLILFIKNKFKKL